MAGGLSFLGRTFRGGLGGSIEHKGDSIAGEQGDDGFEHIIPGIWNLPHDADQPSQLQHGSQ